jgi:hypothetical protein
VLLELVLGAEGIIVSRNEQAWDSDIDKMFDTQLVRFVRRVERITK